MKKDKTKTIGYTMTEIIIGVIIFGLIMLIAGTLDYNDLKETENYWEEQVK